MNCIPNINAFQRGRLYLEVTKEANINDLLEIPNCKFMVLRFREIDLNEHASFEHFTFFENILRISPRRFNQYVYVDVTHLFASEQKLRELNVL